MRSFVVFPPSIPYNLPAWVYFFYLPLLGVEKKVDKGNVVFVSVIHLVLALSGLVMLDALAQLLPCHVVP